MCGIAGWLDFGSDLRKNEHIFSAMSDTLKRRGPDDAGAYISENVALFHRRLAVVDIENGKQPMYKKVGNNEYIIVYNGELYNTDEIRAELSSEGYRFCGHSDTEVLLLSYIKWGESALKHLNGIFAFAIYDKAKDTLFFARDRAGVKPFFFHTYNNGFIFGSEIKTILANPRVSRTVDRFGIGEIFLIGPGRTPGASAFSDINELRPGECGTFSKDGLSIRKYWQIEANEHTDSLEETLEKVRYLVTDSIKRQLISDVPLCCFL